MSARSRRPAPASKARAIRALAGVGRRFYARQWVLGTSGNFSTVLSRDPMRLLLTASAAHKGTLRAGEFVEVDAAGRVIGGRGGRPSAETLLHLSIVKARGASAVLHTHSVWGTILSDRHADARGLTIHSYEMLKGLDGVTTHEHEEWVPIVENDQDMTRLSRVVDETLLREARAHGFLIRGHGLYTWGKSIADAERHVEILEFLFETLGRRSEPWQS
jgi:methylthioribulose-1-phosphate dehydratase